MQRTGLLIYERKKESKQEINLAFDHEIRTCSSKHTLVQESVHEKKNSLKKTRTRPRKRPRKKEPAQEETAKKVTKK